MKFFTSIGILLLLAISFPIKAGDEFCGGRNTAFSANESLTFKCIIRWQAFILLQARPFLLQRLNN